MLVWIGDKKISAILLFCRTYWTQLACLLLGITIGSSAAWKIQEVRINSIETKFLTYQIEAEKKSVEAAAASIEKERFWIQELDNARVNFLHKDSKYKKEVAAAKSSVGRLHNELTSLSNRLSESSISSYSEALGTVAELFGECSTKYTEMADAADRHRNEVILLLESWPKNIPIGESHAN